MKLKAFVETLQRLQAEHGDVEISMRSEGDRTYSEPQSVKFIWDGEDGFVLVLGD